MTINLEVWEDKAALYNRAVEIIANQLKNGATTFGLATGGTMEPLYEKLRNSSLDFSHCTSVNLDEYVGLSKTHPESYYTFMQQHLFDAKPFKATNVPNGEAEDVHAEAIRYENLLKSLTLDMQLLGVGVNGHIGFNEPGTSFESETAVVKLTDSTRSANARFFDSIDEVPEEAITMGISSIMRAKFILLIAVGETKRAAIEALLNGDVTEEIPVTKLRDHPNVIVLTDLKMN
ncbi:glucosamine-6-phosphate deaminase [Psychrobacillus sp. OK028]|uniref:glucosamine-6-phosphate deaminase n=1 Tax=Psychrobacillus sp. OK028 TaxID=1884359 RepID=UPI00088EB339|nr:glucosamine-6-phosphate deaminase [Psychrobacillus sp. OK028]SDN71358.1 glucosamine-6-phosphate deaminase [Psychrobacillus sp. OK028]